MGTFGTNRIYSVGRMVRVADRMRWGFTPAWVRFPSYLKCKIHQQFDTTSRFGLSLCFTNSVEVFVDSIRRVLSKMM